MIRIYSPTFSGVFSSGSVITSTAIGIYLSELFGPKFEPSKSYNSNFLLGEFESAK